MAGAISEKRRWDEELTETEDALTMLFSRWKGRDDGGDANDRHSSIRAPASGTDGRQG
jgi:hypothetical protein